MTDSCLLLTLPTEIRLLIYSYVFCMPWGCDAQGEASLECDALDREPQYPAGEVVVEISRTIRSYRRDECCRHFAAILQTCKQICEEATDTLYQQTHFRIAVGAAGPEMVDTDGKLRLRSPWWGANNADSESIGTPLQDLSLFKRMQHTHLELSIAKQTNPLWDILPVTHAILAALNPERKRTTATLRFGLMAAITCARLTCDPWERFVHRLRELELGCSSDVEVDADVSRWTPHGQRERFENFAATLGGQLRFVRFVDELGPHDGTLRACVVQ